MDKISKFNAHLESHDLSPAAENAAIAFRANIHQKTNSDDSCHTYIANAASELSARKYKSILRRDKAQIFEAVVEDLYTHTNIDAIPLETVMLIAKSVFLIKNMIRSTRCSCFGKRNIDCNKP